MKDIKYNRQKLEKLSDDLCDAIKKQNLVIFIGAGVSISQGYPNWDTYIEHLIKYWQGQILREKFEFQLGREHYLVFDLINKANISNKRKVDLVNYELKRIYQDSFKGRRLDFEKNYFSNLLPFQPVNEILQSLASLDAIFITSNYDFEIENHLKRLKNEVTTINDLNEFKQLRKVQLRLNDVLHIHGTSSSHPDFFVSSSADYMNTYLKSRQNFEELIKWFEDNKPTVLFIGSSLEEDELLSLLQKDSNNYALMRADKGMANSAEEHYKQIMEEFFIQENNTQIIWFGDSFADLPNYISDLVLSVNQKLNKNEFQIDWHQLLNPRLNPQEYNDYLYKISEHPKFLRALFEKVIELDDKELSQLLVNGSLNGKTFDILKSTRFPEFWKLLKIYLKGLSQQEWEKIYEIILEGKQYFYTQEFYDVFLELQNQESFDVVRINELRKQLATSIDINFSPLIQDSYLVGYWFINVINNESRYIFTKGLENTEVFLNQESLQGLVDKLNSKENYYRYSLSSLDEIFEQETIRFFYNLLKSNRLKIDNQDFLENIPEELLTNRLLQRLLVYLDNNQGISDSLLEKLIDKIDFEQRTFGEELNKFIQTHKKLLLKKGKSILDSYQNAVYQLESGWVKHHSFLSREDLLSKTELELCEILAKAPAENSRNSLLEEETIPETENFLLQIIEEESEPFQKIITIFLNQSERLFSKFKRFYTKVAINDKVLESIRIKFKEVIISYFRGNHFDDNDYDFFKYFSKQSDVERVVIDKLLTVDVNNLSILKGDDGAFDFFHYHNSEMGSYLICLLSVNNNHIDYNLNIIEKIDSIKDNDYRELTQGMFLNEYQGNEIDITYNTLIGFIYSHTMISREASELFQGTIIKALQTVILDNQILRTLYMLALEGVNPSMLAVDFPFDKNNYSQMIRIIFTSKYNFRYEKEWLENLFRNHNPHDYLNTLVHLFSNKELKLEKFRWFLELARDAIANSDNMVDSYALSYQISKAQGETLELFLDYFWILLKNNKIKNDYYYEKLLSEILKYLNKASGLELIDVLQTQQNIPPIEIEKLNNLVYELN